MTKKQAQTFYGALLLVSVIIYTVASKTLEMAVIGLPIALALIISKKKLMD